MFIFKHSHDTHAPQSGGVQDHPRGAAGVSRWGADFPRWFLSGGSILLLSLLAFVGVSPVLAQTATAGQITEFPVAQGNPAGLVRGSDGNLWFATPPPVTNSHPTFGRITSTGQITQFADPIANAGGAQDLTLGPDGNVWFFDRQGFSNEHIGRITPTGQITQFADPLKESSGAGGLTLGPDGNVWFAEFAANAIGRITTH